jgi:hypothetical protein
MRSERGLEKWTYDPLGEIRKELVVESSEEDIGETITCAWCKRTIDDEYATMHVDVEEDHQLPKMEMEIELCTACAAYVLTRTGEGYIRAADLLDVWKEREA